MSRVDGEFLLVSTREVRHFQSRATQVVVRNWIVLRSADLPLLTTGLHSRIGASDAPAHVQRPVRGRREDFVLSNFKGGTRMAIIPAHPVILRSGSGKLPDGIV